VATIPLGIEQVVLRALSKEPKARFASVRDFAEALEQASQRTPAHPMLLLPEVPAPDLAATTNYATVPVASSQPVLSIETTPSADRPARALEPTTFPGSTLPQDLAAPQSQDEEGMPLPGHMVAPTAAVISSPLEPIMPVRQRIRRFSGSRAVMLIGLTVLIIAGGILSTISLLAHVSVKRTATPASAQTPQDLYDQITQGTPALDDPLSTNDTNNWTETTTADGKFSCVFSGGVYHASAPYTPCLAQATNFGDLAYQVQMTIVKGEFGGLVFRVDSSQTKYYSFLIDSSGTYSLITSVDNTGTRDYVLHKGTSVFFKTGLNQANLISVIARGSSISLYINKHYVTSASDRSYRAGQIGLFGGDYTQAPADVVFRHVQIWQL
jgi:hypothetical protein